MLGLLVDKLIHKYFCNWKEYENTVQITVKYTLENLRTRMSHLGWNRHQISYCCGLKVCGSPPKFLC